MNSKPKRILDVGCGTGELIRHLSERSNNQDYLFGIDVSAENIKVCNEKKSSDKQKFILNKAERLPFPSDYFDEVHCYEVLEHVKDLKLTLDEIKRVLKANGRFSLSVPLKESELILSSINPDYPKQIGHRRFFSKQDILRVLRENNFPVIDYLAYNSIEHLYWKSYFKKGGKIVNQIAGVDKKNSRLWRIAAIAFSREIVYLRKQTKKPLHYLAILILHLGYPIGLIMDLLLTNKKQKIVSINKK